MNKYSWGVDIHPRPFLLQRFSTLKCDRASTCVPAGFSILPHSQQFVKGFFESYFFNTISRFSVLKWPGRSQARAAEFPIIYHHMEKFPYFQRAPASHPNPETPYGPGICVKPICPVPACKANPQEKKSQKNLPSKSRSVIERPP